MYVCICYHIHAYLQYILHHASTMMKGTSCCIIVSRCPSFSLKLNYSIKQSTIMSLVISGLVTSKCDKNAKTAW